MISLTFIKNEQFERFVNLCSTRRLMQNLGEKSEKTFWYKLKKIYVKYYKPDMEKLNIWIWNGKGTRIERHPPGCEVYLNEGLRVTVWRKPHEGIYYNILGKKCNFIFFCTLLPMGEQGSTIALEIIWLESFGRSLSSES